MDNPKIFSAFMGVSTILSLIFLGMIVASLIPNEACIKTDFVEVEC